MAIARLSDAEIASLVDEQKNSDTDFAELNLKSSSGHRRQSYSLIGHAGSRFTLFLRQNSLDSFDFSAILGYHIPGTNTVFRLRRYNGRHFHTNAIENETIYGCHIHIATERYQIRGGDEEAFAIETTLYSDLRGALACLIADCHILVPGSAQLPLL